MTLPPSFPPGSSRSHPRPENSPQVQHQAANQPTYPAFPSTPNGTNRPDLRTVVVVGSSATPATQHQGLSYTDLALPASYAPGSAANHHPGTCLLYTSPSPRD